MHLVITYFFEMSEEKKNNIPKPIANISLKSKNKQTKHQKLFNGSSKHNLVEHRSDKKNSRGECLSQGIIIKQDRSPEKLNFKHIVRKH